MAGRRNDVGCRIADVVPAVTAVHGVHVPLVYPRQPLTLSRGGRLIDLAAASQAYHQSGLCLIGCFNLKISRRDVCVVFFSFFFLLSNNFRSIKEEKRKKEQFLRLWNIIPSCKIFSQDWIHFIYQGWRKDLQRVFYSLASILPPETVPSSERPLSF